MCGNNKYSECLLYISAILIISGMICPQAIGGQSLRHPDGIVGKPNGRIWGQYVSVSPGKGVKAEDRQRGGITLGWPILSRMSIAGRYQMDKSDSLFHTFGFDGIFYFGNPLDLAKQGNPDGILLIPILGCGFGFTIADQEPKNHRFQVEVKFQLPILTWLTVGSEYHYYDKRPNHIINRYAGMIKIHTGEYSVSERYLNPDAPEGSISFVIKGGGSGDGIFGEIMALFPLRSNMTVDLFASGEKVYNPRIVSVAIGFGLRYYPEN
jgi:hypothetical protein